nr:hypothetical protein [Tanacetum cinerariifolium]
MSFRKRSNNAVKFPEAFLCLVRLSRHYTLDEETYPRFVHKNEEGGYGPICFHSCPGSYQIIPDRAESELKASVDRLFDEGGSGHQTKQGDSTGVAHDANIQPVVKDADTIVEDAAPLFIISSDSSYHSGLTIAEAEVDSLVMSSTPIMTTATTITSTVDSTLVAKEKPVKPSFFAIDSSSAGGADPNTGSVTNGSRLNDDRVCREMVDEFAPSKFFASVRGMKHDQLFTKFNVRAARQMSLSVEAMDGEIENLKAQLLLKDAKVTEAIRLRAQTSNFEAVEKSLRMSLADQVHKLEVSFSELQVKITVYDNCMEQLEKFQDDRMKVVNDKLEKLDSDLAEMAWDAISRVIEKGMQSNLAAGIDHGREGRSLADVAVYNPDAKADFNTALQELREVEFHLLAKLKSYKDASTKNIMNVLCLEGAFADAPGMNDSQPNIEQLKVPIHRSEDQVVLGETSLSFALSVSHSREERIKKNITAQRVVPVASVTTTALSITFASASFIPPISTNDYEIVGVDGQEGAGTDGRVLIDGNVAPFPNVYDVELHIL